MYRFFKRTLDILIAIFSLLVLSVIFIPCIIILFCTGEHEIWYFQERIGVHCRPFRIFKFATMRKDSESMGAGDITLRGDKRVLPFGRILRKTKINELPQIINVLLGAMSIVGPRPLTLKQFQFYSPDVQKTIGTMKPGITGIGSIIFRDEEKYTSEAKDPKAFYRDYISPYKGALEVWYAGRASFWLDIKLIVLTAWVILFSKSNLPHKCLKDLPEKPEWMN